MATTLEVVNECLATLGESPLNTLTEPHTFKSAALKAIDKANRRIQSRGWWFNVESITMKPAPDTGQMQLPGDCLKWASGVRTPDTLERGLPKPWVIQRGSRLYDTRTRGYEFTEEAVGEITRLVPFEDLPQVVNDFVAAEAVLKFQSSFDADNSRRQELAQAWMTSKIELSAEQTRQAGVNLLNNNVRLNRIKSAVRRLRY